MEEIRLLHKDTKTANANSVPHRVVSPCSTETRLKPEPEGNLQGHMKFVGSLFGPT